MTLNLPTIDDVRLAEQRIRPHVSPAPLIRSYELEKELKLGPDRRVWIKDYGWTPVGSFKPNHNGLFDMSGNVSDWITDFFEIRPVRGEPLLDPIGPDTGNRYVIRGASWARASRSELRLAYRSEGSDGNTETGFRIARYVDKAMVEP